MHIRKTDHGLACDVVVNIPHGLHARPSAKVAQAARKYQSEIMVIGENGEVDAKSMLDLLSLASHENARVTVVANGPDAEMALKDICQLLASPGE